MRKNSSLFSPAIPQAYLHGVRRLSLDGAVEGHEEELKLV
jgi:hypothetical protein